MRRHSNHCWLVAVVALALPASLVGQGRPPADTLYLTHFDVGQGDATLVTTPRGRRILIDAGSQGDSIAARLRRVGIDTLDLLVSTHNHIDHIGGIADVFAAFVVRRYLDNNVPCETQVCGRTLFAAANEPALIHIDGGLGDTIDGVYVRYLPQPPRSSNENDNSIGIMIQFGSFRALYTGDSQADELRHWVEQAAVSRVAVLKAAHHGSINGATQAWIEATNPSVVVISVGTPNAYGHPAPNVVLGWTQAGAKVFRTDYLGTIQISAVRDGNFSVKFYRETQPKRRE